MDQRLPQHPFSRGNASTYSHAPFQSSSNPASYSSSSHPANAPPSYQDSQRRPVENSYYSQPAPYTRDSAPIPSSGHSRHGSSSSIGHGPPISRNMPPPSSPQQQHQQIQHAQHPHTMAYPPPSLSRGPPPALNNPISFPASRDLPSLLSMHRPGSVNSSMSISSMLGGPSADSREAAQPASQYPPPPQVMPSPHSAPSYAAQSHTSPRSSILGPEYGRFRRPRTPDHRLHEAQGLRDRANSAGSPPGPGLLSTPEAHRYGTPQAYSQRSIQHQHTASLDDRREQGPMRVPNPNSTFPPRPSSQPTVYSGPPPRITETSRRIIDPGPPEPPYGRHVRYSEREDILALYEHERLEEEAILRQRERERMEQAERAHYASQAAAAAHEGPSYGRQYPQQQSGTYNDPREPAPWMMRARQEQSPPEQAHPPSHPQATPSGSYDYPRNAAQAYNVQPEYPSREAAYATGHGPAVLPQYQKALSIFEEDRLREERQRMVAAEQARQQAYQGVQSQQGNYRLQESPRARPSEEVQQQQQRGYLGVQQEINQKGRRSPFPQAVQGAQSQHSGPGAEPGIKNEFGKMFSGIGSGVGSMATPGATSSGVQTPFSNSGQVRREDLDGLLPLDPLADHSVHKLTRTASRGSRRRKLKEEDSRGDDESSTGRRTPSGRASKRAKNTHQAMANSRK
jgi:hypothetical protein